MPSLAATWKQLRAGNKSNRHASRSQSEIMSSRRPQIATQPPSEPLPPGCRATTTTVEYEHARDRKHICSEKARYAIEQELALRIMRSPSPSPCEVPSPHQQNMQQERVTNSIRVDSVQLRVFVGSWNMAAKDPFATAKGAYCGDATAANKLREFLPPGYDLYVLGTQEKVSKHLHAAVLARLNASNQGRRFVSLHSQARTGSGASKGRSTKRSARRRQTRSKQSSDTPSTASSTEFESDHSQLSSFALEASASRGQSDVEDLTQSWPPRSLSRRGSIPILGALNDSNIGSQTNTFKVERTVQQQLDHEIRGRGDGAFLTAKSTSLAFFCAEELVGTAVEIMHSGAHKFSMTSGSKGGVAVMLRVAQAETITFLNCHLEANRPALRRKQLGVLQAKLAHAMGFTDVTELSECSNHVVAMGDFNYRIHTLDGESVLKLLSSGRHLEMHDRYDSMKDDLVTIPALRRFLEPRKWPTFYPTYKKIPGRRPTTIEERQCDPTWPTRVYRVLFREPIYKGGKVKARVPGWCDRILYSSSSHQQSAGGTLRVEKTECHESMESLRASRRTHHQSKDSTRTDTSSSNQEEPGLLDNYRSVNDSLFESDHSPVFCTFTWELRGVQDVLLRESCR